MKKIFDYSTLLSIALAIFAALFVLAAISCVTPGPLPSGVKETCGNITGTPAKYCLETVMENAPCTLWYWHGYQENQGAYRSTQYPHPEFPVIQKKFSCNIVTISYGTFWMIGADKKPTSIIPGMPVNASPTLANVLDVAVPFIEKKHKLSTHRWSMGVSMGGYNLATMIMSRSTYFEKAIVIDPVMLNNEGGMATFLVFSNFNLLTWLKFSPNNVIVSTKALPKTYFEACQTDEMVPFDGPNDFQQKASKKFPNDFVFHLTKAGCKHAQSDLQPQLDWLALPMPVANLVPAVLK